MRCRIIPEIITLTKKCEECFNRVYLNLKWNDTLHTQKKCLKPGPSNQNRDIKCFAIFATALLFCQEVKIIVRYILVFKAFILALKAFKHIEDFRRPVPYGPSLQMDYIPAALTYRKDEIDIYSCSFNLHNNFRAASLALRTALKEGVEMVQIFVLNC